MRVYLHSVSFTFIYLAKSSLIIRTSGTFTQPPTVGLASMSEIMRPASDPCHLSRIGSCMRLVSVRASFQCHSKKAFPRATQLFGSSLAESMAACASLEVAAAGLWARSRREPVHGPAQGGRYQSPSMLAELRSPAEQVDGSLVAVDQEFPSSEPERN